MVCSPVNRKRRILVGEFAEVFWQEQLTRHLPHCLKNEFIADATCGDITLDHLLAAHCK